MTNPDRPPSARSPWRRTALAATLLAGTALGGFAIAQSGVAATDPAGATPGAPVNPPGSGMSHTLPDFTDLVTQVKPAVVSITSKMQAGPAADEDEPQMPRQFRQFPFGGMGPQHGPADACSRGTRLRLHRRCRWHDRHQQPRGEERKDGIRHAGRWHHGSGAR